MVSRLAMVPFFFFSFFIYLFIFFLPRFLCDIRIFYSARDVSRWNWRRWIL